MIGDDHPHAGLRFNDDNNVLEEVGSPIGNAEEPRMKSGVGDSKMRWLAGVKRAVSPIHL